MSEGEVGGDAHLGIPAGFRSLELIQPVGQELCMLNSEDIQPLTGCFPLGVEILEPNPLMSADYVSDEWLGFPEYPFLLGLRFPFPSLISRFFEVSGLAFTQLMPVGWRNLVTLERLRNETGLDIGLEELAFSYNIRSHGNFRFGFRVKAKPLSLVVDSIDRDRDWKYRFFFVKRSSLKDVEGFRSEWLTEATSLDILFPAKQTTAKLVRQICALPVSQRRFVRLEREAFGLEEVEVGNQQAEECAHRMSSVSHTQTSFGAKELMAMFHGKSKEEEVNKPKVPKLEKEFAEGSRKRKPVEIIDVEDLSLEAVRKKAASSVELLFEKATLLQAKADSAEDLIKTKDLKFKMTESALNVKKKEVMEFHAFNEKLSKQVEDLKAQLRKLPEEHRLQVEALRRQMMKDAAKSVFEARIQMIEERDAGKDGEWDLEAEKTSLQRVIGVQVDGGVAAQDEQVGETDAVNEGAAS